MTQTTPTLWRVQYRTATDSGTQAEGLTFAEADEIARDLTRLEIEQHQGDQVTEYFLVPYQADQTHANQKITEYDPPNIEFLKNLPHKIRPSGHHFTETWEQAFERVSKLPEPERSKLLKELRRLEAKERLRNIGENLPSTDDFLAQRRIDSRDD